MTLSTKTFILSQLFILTISLAALGSLYYFVNTEQFKKNDLKDYLPVTTKPLSFNLDIKNPEDELLVFDNSILISGTSAPRATILISTPQEDLGLETDSLGDFQQVITLDEGLNEITISAFDERGNEKLVERTIYYSKEKLE